MNQFTKRTKLIVLSFLLACVGVALPSLVYASTIVVDTTTDSVGSFDNRCSLREAVENANTNTRIHSNCIAGNGADVIQFSLPPTTTTTTISLSSIPGPFVITDSLTIDGANGGNRITIDGTGITNIFEIPSNSNLIDVNLRTLGLMNGRATRGGAVSVRRGRLSIEGVSLEGNRATGEGGAIYCQNAEVRITNSTFTNNQSDPFVGGGASYFGSCTSVITNSSFERNSAFFDGGALYANTSTVTIIDSNFNDNKAESFGGVAHAISSTIQITTSTFFSNSANLSGGAIDFSNGTVAIANSNFISNTADSSGGAIACLDGNLSITSNTFTTNKAPVGGVVEYSTCSSRVINNTFERNVADNNGGVIAFNGDTGDVLTITNSSFRSNKANGLGGAIFVGYPSDTITITNSTLNDNQAGEGGAIYSMDDNGNGANIAIISSVLTSNLSSGDGGSANFNGGSVTIIDTQFNGNTANDNVFSTAEDGGAIYTKDGLTSVINTTFANNIASGSGGAIYFIQQYDGIPAAITRGVFTNNVANGINEQFIIESGGGAIYCLSDSSFNVFGSNFTGNRVEGRDGGAISLIDSCTLGITDTLLIKNIATDDGGAIASVGSTVQITNSTLSENQAQNGDGGAIYSIGDSGSGGSGELRIINSTISGNLANNDRGGAIYNGGDDDPAATILRSTTIVNNRAKQGGGIFNIGSSSSSLATTEITNTIIAGNIKNDPNLTPDDCFNSLDLDQSFITSSGNNLVGISSNCAFTATGDIQINPALVFTQVLNPNLADNGGPTLTHALLPGSPAIDAGSNCPPPTTDQRGEPRISPCDIGAYEAKVYSLQLTSSATTAFVGLSVNVIATVTDQFTNPPDPGLPVFFGASGLNPPSAVIPINGNQAVSTFKREVNTRADTPISAWFDLDGDLTQDGFEPTDTITITWRPITMTVDGQSIGTDVEAQRILAVTIRSDDPLREPVTGLDVGFNVTGGNVVPTEISKTNSLGQVIFMYISRAPLQMRDAANPPTEIRPAQVSATGCGGILPPTASDTIRVWVDLIANRTPDGGEPLFVCDLRSAITLASFIGQGQDGKVILLWQTAVEIDNAGFNLYRAVTPGGPDVKINPQLIPGQGTGYGASYTFVDTPLGPGPFYYKLEDVDYNGKSTFHGPIEVRSVGTVDFGANRVYMPLVQR